MLEGRTVATISSQVTPAVEMKVLSQRVVLGHVFTTKYVAAEKRSSKGYQKLEGHPELNEKLLSELN